MATQNYFLASHRQPIIIAHRGAAGSAPENTLASFRRAIVEKADAIELDVQRTRDGRLIIMHDPFLGRTTSGRGLIGRKTLRHLQTLDAGSHHSKAFTGERMPSLADVLDEFGKNINYVIELKFYQPDKADFARQVYEMVAQRGLLAQTLFLSFSPRILKALKVRNPTVATCYAVLPTPGFRYQTSLEAANVIGVDAKTNPPKIDRLHARGKLVNAWSNSHRHLERLVAHKVEMITTNHPAEVRRLLEEL